MKASRSIRQGLDHSMQYAHDNSIALEELHLKQLSGEKYNRQWIVQRSSIGSFFQPVDQYVLAVQQVVQSFRYRRLLVSSLPKILLASGLDLQLQTATPADCKPKSQFDLAISRLAIWAKPLVYACIAWLQGSGPDIRCRGEAILTKAIYHTNSCYWSASSPPRSCPFWQYSISIPLETSRLWKEVFKNQYQ